MILVNPDTSSICVLYDCSFWVKKDYNSLTSTSILFSSWDGGVSHLSEGGESYVDLNTHQNRTQIVLLT